MRYYVIFIQFNKDAQAENRTVPKAFDTLDDAIAEFHTQMGKDMKNATLGWSMGTIINSEGGQYQKYTDKWVRPVEPEPTPEVKNEEG